MCDRTDEMSGALVHHGPVSDRAYLVRSSGDARVDVELLELLGRERGYGKLFAKVLSGAQAVFEEAGFVAEARVPLHHLDEELVFYSRFLDPERGVEQAEAEIELVLGESASASANAPSEPSVDMPGAQLADYDVTVASVEEASEIAHLYADVFESYPFPITSPEFVAGEMEAGTVFAVARSSGSIVAASSAEIDAASASCEMTDFATAAGHRGAGLASALLGELERIARERAVMVAYTIARATSIGMNNVFARRGYGYGGLLLNNTGICGGIESMNVWHRALAEGPA